jgi:hypothetical protein
MHKPLELIDGNALIYLLSEYAGIDAIVTASERGEEGEH